MGLLMLQEVVLLCWSCLQVLAERFKIISLGSADCGCASCTSGLLVTGYQKKQLMFACRIPLGLTLGYSLHNTVYGEKTPNKFLVIFGTQNLFSMLNSNDFSTILRVFNFQSCCLMLVQLKNLVNVQLAEASISVPTTLEPWQLIPTI